MDISYFIDVFRLPPRVQEMEVLTKKLRRILLEVACLWRILKHQTKPGNQNCKTENPENPEN